LAFESGSRLFRISESAWSHCPNLKSRNIPQSAEICPGNWGSNDTLEATDVPEELKSKIGGKGERWQADDEYEYDEEDE
jgi:hypothetical protein